MEGKTFLDWILGDMESAKFLAAMVFAVIGIAINMLFEIMSRDVKGDKTPEKFKFSFLVYDNKRKFIASIILNFLLVLVFIRFTHDLLDMELSMFIALIIGASVDKLLTYFKKIKNSVISSDREKFNKDKKGKK